MSYFLHSIKTISYWKYALLSPNSISLFFAVLGGAWTLLEIAQFFHLFNHKIVSLWWLLSLMLIALIVVISTRRPISKICYKIPGKDLLVEVKIGNLFEVDGQKIISTNTTFDTDIARGIISADSLQGQFSTRYFPSDLNQLDQQLEAALVGIPFTAAPNAVGKTKRYEIGTVAKLTICNEYFYWVAMAELNQHGNSVSDLDTIKKALAGLWTFLANRGENQTIVMPIMGSGRGRVRTNRKKLIEIIAQSFIDTSNNLRLFSNRLVIVIPSMDAQSFEINLFEVKDYLVQALEY